MNKILHKIFYAICTIFLAVTAIFFVIRIAPGDPVVTILGERAKLEEIEKIRNDLGLNQKLYIQYGNYIKHLSQGDLGKTLIGNREIRPLLLTRMKPTMFIGFITMIISSVLGIALGVFTAINKEKRSDSLLRVISLLFLSVPVFSLAPLLVLMFSIKLNFFPVSEWGRGEHYFLPVFSLAIPLSLIIMRVTRNRYLDERKSYWVLVCRSKGLSEFQIALRVLKVSFPTILTIVSIQLSSVLAGTMIIETIFDIPGMGTLLFEGIQNRDYFLVQAVIIYSTTIYMLIYFSVEYLNEWLDPRMKKV